MRKKTSVDFQGSNELSRLLTQERLEIAGVKGSPSASNDPDLNALMERVRSSGAKKGQTARVVTKRAIRKLVSG
jgi:hypothetical protein